MLTPGINAAFHDCSADVVRDGIVMAAAEGERLSRDEPIACTPRDALEPFCTTPLEALAIDPFIVDKAARGGP